MKDEIISFETAQLAKKRGFDEEVLHFYCKNRTCNYLDKPYEYSFKVDANQESLTNGEVDNFGYGLTWSAPTQSLLQRWLREKHNILVFIAYCEDGFVVQSWKKEDLEECEYPEFDVYTTAETYEEALETGLIEALKLIKP